MSDRPNRLNPATEPVGCWVKFHDLADKEGVLRDGVITSYDAAPLTLKSGLTVPASVKIKEAVDGVLGAERWIAPNPLFKGLVEVPEAELHLTYLNSDGDVIGREAVVDRIALPRLSLKKLLDAGELSVPAGTVAILFEEVEPRGSLYAAAIARGYSTLPTTRPDEVNQMPGLLDDIEKLWQPKRGRGGVLKVEGAVVTAAQGGGLDSLELGGKKS